MIFGARVTQAREFAQLTQAQLAASVGVAQATIADLERGRIQPSSELLAKIASSLHFDPQFFSREVPQHFALGTLEFRARASMSAKEKKHAYQYAHLVFELASLLASRLNMPRIRLPRIEGDPEECAALIRSELGVSPEGAVPNLTDVLERSGVLVFALSPLYETAFDRVDGFSVWAASGNKLTPAIFLSAKAPGDRQRLTMAHEIAELAISDMPPGRDRERKANRFAGAFLMPADRFREELLPPFSMLDFIDIKKRYGVSIQAAMVRAHHLNIIDERRYHALYQQLSARGWRREEPFPVVPEKPRALHKMIELLYGNPINVVKLSADSKLSPILLRNILSVHASRSDLAGATRLQETGKVISFPTPGITRSATSEYDATGGDIEEM